MAKVYAYAALASMVYKLPDESDVSWKHSIAERLQERGWGLFTTLQEGATQAMLVDMPETTALVFRGTEKDSLHDILVDLRATPKQIGCKHKVHSGAWAALNSLWDQVEAALPLVRDKPISFVGHSLGGLLASLCAYRVLKRKKAPVCINHLATFGAPAPGNKAFSSMLCSVFNGSLMRVVRRADYVPRFKSLWLMGYRHPDCCMYIDANDLVWRDSTKLFRAMDRLPFLSYSLKDHSHVAYAKILSDFHSTYGDIVPLPRPGAYTS